MDDDRRMPFLEHVRELRTRLRNAVLALLVAWAVCFAFAELLLSLLARPLINAWHAAHLPADAQLNFGGLTEPFWVYFRISLYAAIVVAAPVMFHQLWKFIAPGLYARERRFALPFAFCSALFFTGGVLFCYFLVLPAAYRFFLSYSGENVGSISRVFNFLGDAGPSLAVQPILLMQEYLDLSTTFLIAFGAVFELPLLIFFLSWAGLVTHRSLWRWNKYAIILSFVLGGLLTPGPDVVSQLLMAGPMIVLYNLSITIAWVVTRRREHAATAAAAVPR